MFNSTLRYIWLCSEHYTHKNSERKWGEWCTKRRKKQNKKKSSEISLVAVVIRAAPKFSSSFDHSCLALCKGRLHRHSEYPNTPSLPQPQSDQLSFTGKTRIIKHFRQLWRCPLFHGQNGTVFSARIYTKINEEARLRKGLLFISFFLKYTSF